MGSWIVNSVGISFHLLSHGPTFYTRSLMFVDRGGRPSSSSSDGGSGRLALCSRSRRLINCCQLVACWNLFKQLLFLIDPRHLIAGSACMFFNRRALDALLVPFRADSYSVPVWLTGLRWTHHGEDVYVREGFVFGRCFSEGVWQGWTKEGPVDWSPEHLGTDDLRFYCLTGLAE